MASIVLSAFLRWKTCQTVQFLFISVEKGSSIYLSFFQQIITIVQKFYNLLPKFAQSMARQGFGIIIMILIKALQSMINFVFCNNIKILVFLTFPSATVRRRRKNGNDFDKSWMNWISWRLNQGGG